MLYYLLYYNTSQVPEYEKATCLHADTVMLFMSLEELVSKFKFECPLFHKSICSHLPLEHSKAWSGAVSVEIDSIPTYPSSSCLSPLLSDRGRLQFLREANYFLLTGTFSRASAVGLYLLRSRFICQRADPGWGMTDAVRGDTFLWD